MSPLPARRTIALAALADLVAVVVFVLVGRSSHHEQAGSAEVLKVIAPFAIALLVAWLATRAWRAPLAAFPTGASLWLITAGLGLVLRRFAFQRSTALAFVIVGSVFLLAALVGWRTVAEFTRRNRS